eukprot:TRINITY_DN114478_c0_g1_i1.p1 TRINITY_DN114478_c0_g1~~TRINITY_DN114478_c0_g1_i1.p1  ORF type:complete len:232 (-),score=23.84 TRINITY_DN114478_c0_g1_i1:16-711(-)
MSLGPRLTALDVLNAHARLEEQLEARSSRGGRRRERVSCGVCQDPGEAVALKLPASVKSALPALQRMSFSTWQRTLRALQTPHCKSCGTFCHDAPPKTQKLLKCECCKGLVASDATLCMTCGTTTIFSSPGSILPTKVPELQRCFCCGNAMAANADICLRCGGPNQRTLFGNRISLTLETEPCLGCQERNSVAAPFCIHCGHSTTPCAGLNIPAATSASNGYTSSSLFVFS